VAVAIAVTTVTTVLWAGHGCRVPRAAVSAAEGSKKFDGSFQPTANKCGRRALLRHVTPENFPGSGVVFGVGIRQSRRCPTEAPLRVIARSSPTPFRAVDLANYGPPIDATMLCVPHRYCPGLRRNGPFKLLEPLPGMDTGLELGENRLKLGWYDLFLSNWKIGQEDN